MLPRRIELPASPLPRVRSTTELQQHMGIREPPKQRDARYRPRAIVVCAAQVKQSLRIGCAGSNSVNVNKPATPGPNASSREERLAAQLRANLRRRKAQTRTQAEDASTCDLPKDGESR